MFQSNQLLL